MIHCGVGLKPELQKRMPANPVGLKPDLRRGISADLVGLKPNRQDKIVGRTSVRPNPTRYPKEDKDVLQRITQRPFLSTRSGLFPNPGHPQAPACFSGIPGSSSVDPGNATSGISAATDLAGMGDHARPSARPGKLEAMPPARKHSPIERVQLPRHQCLLSKKRKFVAARLLRSCATQGRRSKGNRPLYRRQSPARWTGEISGRLSSLGQYLVGVMCQYPVELKPDLHREIAANLVGLKPDLRRDISVDLVELKPNRQDKIVGRTSVRPSPLPGDNN